MGLVSMLGVTLTGGINASDDGCHCVTVQLTAVWRTLILECCVCRVSFCTAKAGVRRLYPWDLV
jgi:hypothetical protein